MKSIEKILRKLPLTLKMVGLTILVGFMVWIISDYHETRSVRKLVNDHLYEMLQQQALEDRIRFDNYLGAFRQVAKLTVSQSSFIEYLEENKWFREESISVENHNALPEWSLKKSILRRLAVPRFAILIDGKGETREVFERQQDVMPLRFYEPSQLLLEKSIGQPHMIMDGKSPFLVTSQIVSGPENVQVTLMLISPIDDEFLHSSQSDFPNRLVALVSSDNSTIITSSNKILIPPGAKLAELKEKYFISEREFHDYGGAEIIINFTSFVSRETTERMAQTFVANERRQHMIAALIFIFSFLFIMLWITRRVRLLTRKVETFSQDVLGGAVEKSPFGDKLNLLEDRFEKLREEVVSSHKSIQREAEEGAIRQLELERKARQLTLLESVTDAMEVGVIIFEGDKGLPANTLMKRFEDMFGDLSAFNLKQFDRKEHTLRDKFGEEHVFLISGHEMEPDLKAILVSEVTEKVQAVKEKKKLQNELYQAQRMESVGRLAGGVAHDFNNLLTAIIGYASLLSAKMKQDDPLQDFVNSICVSGERAADLTKQLLAFSRKQIINPETLNLNIVLDNLFRMLSRLIGENVEIVIKKSSALWNVLMDQTQIEQIIMNLVINARDAMPYDGGKIVLETENVKMDTAFADVHPGAKPGEYVRLTVSDNGRGISKEDIEHIFEPFFTTKELGKGTGLGLATVYGIIKQNNGNIFVYSEPNKGTSFKIFLPKTEGDMVIADMKPEYHDIPRGNETILLVEDEEDVRTMAVTILSDLGYTLIEAEDGREAVESFEKYHGKIHLLLTDVVMPKMSGSELAQKINDKYPEVKVLFMSGYTEDAVVQQGVLKAGVTFLQKPVSPETLATTVRTLLDGKPA